MTPEQTKIVAESFARLEPRLRDFAATLYQRLFQNAPETHKLFKADMEDQFQKLGKVLGEFVRLNTRSQHLLPVSAGKKNVIIPNIETLKANHLRAGVVASHYPYFAEALLHSVGVYDPKADAAVIDAWLAVFTVFTEGLLSLHSLTANETSSFAKRLNEGAAQDVGNRATASQYEFIYAA